MGDKRRRPVPHLERERGTVEVWSFGERRFIVKVGEHEQEIVGFEEARAAAHALARELGQRPRFAPS